MKGSCQLAEKGDTGSENNESKRRAIVCLTPTLAGPALAEKHGDKDQEEPEGSQGDKRPQEVLEARFSLGFLCPA